MITVVVWRNDQGKITRFLVEGHANYDEHGQDIVCAAVSALAQTSVLSIVKLTGREPELEIGDGKLVCTIPQDLSKDQHDTTIVVLESMVIGLEAIVKEYSSYVKMSQVRR